MKTFVFVFFISILFPKELIQEIRPTFKFSDLEFEVGSIMTRWNLRFTDECKSKVKVSKTLDSVAGFMKSHLNLKMEIGVHEGKPMKIENNCISSRIGADAIKNYLISKGIDKKRLSSVGYGMTEPLAKDENGSLKDPKSVKKNERVVFKITYNKY